MTQPRPLDGVRVIDLTSVLAGPAGTQILADYGADVIKVEAPGGDIMRHAGHMKHEGMGPVYLHANRNKRSMVIDLKQAEGRAVLLDLVRDADLFVHNVRPAAMSRLGLDYADHNLRGPVSAGALTLARFALARFALVAFHFCRVSLAVLWLFWHGECLNLYDTLSSNSNLGKP